MVRSHPVPSTSMRRETPICPPPALSVRLTRGSSGPFGVSGSGVWRMEGSSHLPRMSMAWVVSSATSSGTEGPLGEVIEQATANLPSGPLPLHRRAHLGRGWRDRARSARAGSDAAPQPLQGTVRVPGGGHGRLLRTL